MALQWSGELRNIVDSAERDASRMGTRMNTALLLRSMLKTNSSLQGILPSLGITLDVIDGGLRTLPLQPESLDATSRVYDRAMRLAILARTDEISAFQAMVALLDEPCMGQALLRALRLDIATLRNILLGYISTAQSMETMQVHRSGSQSMASVAVQSKSPIPRPTMYIDPQPAASFGAEDFKDSMLKSRNRLLTPGEIARLGSSASQPAVSRMDKPGRTSSQGNLRLGTGNTRPGSSREMQQATTLDLARRLQQKKSQTSEARRTAELQRIKRQEAVTDESPVLEIEQGVESVDALAKDAAHKKYKEPTTPSQGELVFKPAREPSKVGEVAAEVEAAAQVKKTEGNPAVEPVNEVANEKPEQASGRMTPVSAHTAQVNRASAGTLRKETRPQTNPIISRKNAQLASDAGTVYARKNSFKLKPLPGFNPLALSKTKFPMLCTFGRNMLAEAAAGRLDPVINREHEIDQLIDILNKRRSNNPILVGEAGVGKTAIIEGLALRMAQHDAPRGLEQRTIIALDYGSILCGTQLRGAVQERIKAIKNEVCSAAGHIILFLDEIHSWLSGNNGDPNADAAMELKMALSRGELLCIGASTPQELRRAFNADPAFERRFDYIEVKAPDAETSIRIIEQGIIKQYEAHHEVTYEPDSIREAVRLSERYIQERALPDKAISVLDRAGSLCERSGDTVVTTSHVAHVIAQLAEVPVERLLMTEKQKLMKMEEILGKRLIGHEKNIARIANVIRRNHAGFGAQRPIGSFLFLGPTGVGKTEAAKVLADYLFGSPKNIVRFDMSEFMEQHAVAKLIGAPAGYVGFDDGGLLTEALRKRPYQIVLFDEIEKAHPDIMNILLQILDEGRLTDAKGRHVSFSNAVIIMTSNLGAREVMEMAQNNIGFAGKIQKPTPEEAESIIIKTATSRFSPELWNRIEEKLVFHPLAQSEVEKIAHLLLEDSKKRLFADKRIELSFDELVLIPYLIKHGGYNPEYGARPMRQTVQSLVESKIAEWILSHDDIPKELFIGVRNQEVTVEEVKPMTAL